MVLSQRDSPCCLCFVLKRATVEASDRTTVRAMAAEKGNEEKADRLLIPGRPDYERCDNKVVSSRYTFYNFIPIVR